MMINIAVNKRAIVTNSPVRVVAEFTVRSCLSILTSVNAIPVSLGAAIVLV
jgi:hypothetical protein